MAFLADGVYVGRQQPNTGVDATAYNLPPQHKSYDIAAGRQQHETRKTEMGNIRGQLTNIESNSPDYLKLLNRYHELESEEKTEQTSVRTAISHGADPELNAQEKQKYLHDLTSLDEDISKTVNGDDDGKADGVHDFGKRPYIANGNTQSCANTATAPQYLSGKTHSDGNFFQRHVMPFIGKAKDTAIDGASAAWHKASPVVDAAIDKAAPIFEKAVDKATPYAKAAWNETSPVLEKVADKALPIVDAAWDKASPIVNAAWDKASPTLYAVRDKTINGAAATWNHIPGHEAVEKKLDDWTDSLPFNNAAKASLHALLGSKQITLDKDATQGIQNDQDFKDKEKTIVGDIKSDPRYGKVAFGIQLSALAGADPETKTFPLELGGKSGDMDKKQQLFHIYDLRNPDIRQTWAVAGNEDTWLLRHCQLTGTAHVTADGKITIDYTVKDKLDLSPHGEVDTTYDVVSEKLGAIWHGLLGAEMPQMTGNFTRTVA